MHSRFLQYLGTQGPTALAATLLSTLAVASTHLQLDRPSSAPEADISPAHAELLNLMRGGEREQYRVTLKGRLQTRASLHDPTQGTVTRNFVTVLTPRVTAFSSDTISSGHMGYRLPETPGYHGLDYDEKGNLILWRTEEAHGWVSADLNRRYETLLKTLIAPGDEFVGFEWHHRAQLFPGRSGDSVYEVGQILWAAGRGFSDSIAKVLSLEALPSSGGLELVGEGPGVTPGRWRLELEPGADYLVRRAEYTPPGAGEPSLFVWTTGRVGGEGFSVAREGRVRFGPEDFASLEVDVRFTEAGWQAEPELLDQIRQRVFGPLPNDSSVIIDQRQDPPTYTYPGRD